MTFDQDPWVRIWLALDRKVFKLKPVSFRLLDSYSWKFVILLEPERPHNQLVPSGDLVNQQVPGRNLVSLCKSMYLRL